jgi:hypothetical protein
MIPVKIKQQATTAMVLCALLVVASLYKPTINAAVINDAPTLAPRLTRLMIVIIIGIYSELNPNTANASTANNNPMPDSCQPIVLLA